MWVDSCLITFIDVSCSFFSVVLIGQLFKRDTTTIYIVVLMHMYQQASGQVLGFGGQNRFSGGNIFVFVICLKQTVT